MEYIWREEQSLAMSCNHRRDLIQSNELKLYPKDSLLKYEPARLIIHRDLSKNDYTNICRAILSPSLPPTSFVDANLNLLDPYSNLCRPADILDFLFPPREFLTKTNHKYVGEHDETPPTMEIIIHI